MKTTKSKEMSRIAKIRHAKDTRTKEEKRKYYSQLAKKQWSNVIKITDTMIKQKRQGTWFYKCIDCSMMANFESFLTNHNCRELAKEIGADY